jgi:hypothetical protein
MSMNSEPSVDFLDEPDFLLKQGIVPLAPYNPRNTSNLLSVEYRAVEYQYCGMDAYPLYGKVRQ